MPTPKTTPPAAEKEGERRWPTKRVFYRIPGSLLGMGHWETVPQTVGDIVGQWFMYGFLRFAYFVTRAKWPPQDL